MAERTEISWTDATFNPWTGCTKVSPGCEHCYAEGWSKRAGDKVGKWGPGAPRVRTTEANWRKPLAWNKQAFFECCSCHWRGTGKEADLAHDGISVASARCHVCGSADALRPARRRVFCASLADVFDNEVPIAWLVDFLDLCRQTPNLDKLVLTKRIGNVLKRLCEARGHPTVMLNPDLARWLQAWLDGNAPADVWLGATIVNQEEADRDIAKLLATPARVRFLSMEPLLGPVVLPSWARGVDGGLYHLGVASPMNPAGVDWVITGGESGPHARPMHPDWARGLRDQCAATGVPFHFKQWGEWGAPDGSEDHRRRIALGEAVGWVSLSGRAPVFLAGGDQLLKVGKKAAGRLLDGKTHDAFPEVTRG